VRGYRPNRSGGPWTCYLVAVLFLLVLPLLPLGAELLFTQQIAMSSMMLMTATYSISLSASSRHVGRWAVGLILGLTFATLFGWWMGRGDGMAAAFRLQPGPAAHAGWFWASAGGIIFIFMLHLHERYQRHVTDLDPFPEFLGGDRWSR
jgi:hypothetical protein